MKKVVKAHNELCDAVNKLADVIVGMVLVEIMSVLWKRITALPN